MNRIIMQEPVWNGGNPYFSVRKDRITDKNVFITCDYKDKYGNKMFPNAMYGNGNHIKKTPLHKESWGMAYRLYLSYLEDVFFYASISWDDYSSNGVFIDGAEKVITCSSYEELKESILELLEEHSSRNAYLECASMESEKESHVVNITETIKKELML